MKNILPIIQIIISILLITAILLQQRGTGLSASFGGEGNVYRTKRGFEKILFYGTIILAAAFFLSAIVNVLI
ncbi:MAG: preprotein translocase subunit SecG [Candidatus Sungbacteria bacterium RIFCSPLOWO2_12_FULL_41_11]|uniref:Protein-export membrane protein SecG n=1 Tax=Candidatus Sungbacteria bacterium RIFCSPLOWO2_12_FULL_41_11 TaxID=1802286 RepID=A0A1G2LMN1_9BACT|nr:MAG: preprotein translocase subunit SecG [Candidatus Sungbacteria bacterium RIFCSPHIGHO2_02_FULL_41_12b]OHA12875.1 MAG: preprotein translocase subunit SecG [Candidatus Sungbacteria bacterium RIFCSPLOWO2_12_FULL_41_11]